jgi:hypothetical protein
LPTTQQAVVLAHATPLSAVPTPDVCALQLVPPFAVVRITPPLPTAQQVVVLAQVTPFRLVATPEVCVAHAPVPAVLDDAVIEISAANAAAATAARALPANRRALTAPDGVAA